VAKGQPKDPRDLLECLFEYSEKNPSEAIPEKTIVGDFISFFIAGMDTTGHLCSHSVYFLSKHPEHIPKLREEIKKYYGDGTNLTIESLQKMDYMTACFKEVFRLSTPVPVLFPRMATVDHNLGNIKIK